MWYTYVLYSKSSGKSYVGFTNDIERRLFEHNVSETKGFTLRFRPWVVVHTESFDSKSDALKNEKYLKTGAGREKVKQHIAAYLNGAVSAAAEKD
ncbi:MAG: GIY-YIG nuclease family protein [Chitinophagales bacterium]|nr:GIY-YIG nuclease family protein [Chitinophagales bacterium]